MKKDISNIIGALVVTALSTISALAAGTDTWGGNTDVNWNTAGNWTTSSGSTPPSSGDSLVFGAAGSAGSSLNNDITSLLVNKLTFNSGASSFTFGGNGFTLGSGGIDASALTSGSTTFTPTITIGNGLQRWNVGAGATLAFGRLGSGADATDLYTPNGAVVIVSSTGTKTTTTADGWGWRGGAVAGTGPLGPGMVIDNGDKTYDWASVGTQTAGTSLPIVAATYTTAPNASDAHNVKVTANTTVTENNAWASLLVTGSTLTVNGTALFLDTGIILQNGGTVAGGAPIKSDNTDGLYIYVPDTGTISSSIQNNGVKKLYKSGPGTLTLSGANSYTGNTVIYEGALNFNYGSGANVTFSSGISGVGPVTLTASNGTPRVHFSGNNTYSGGTTIGANVTLEVDAVSGYSANSDYTVNGGMESYNNIASVTIGALNGSGTIYNTGDNANTTPFTVGANGHSGTFSGVIANGAWGSHVTVLVKSGAGTQTLTGANTYSGGTTINAGTLLVNNTSGSGTGSSFVVVTNANTTLGGSGTMSGAVTMNAGTILSPGTNSTTGLTLTCNGGVTFSGGATALFDLSTSAAGANDKLAVTGTLTIGSADTITINPITASTLDTAEYTLFTATSVAGTGTPSLVWGTSTPPNPNYYSIVKNATTVVLHYQVPGAPPVVGTTVFSPVSPVWVGTTVTASASASSTGTGLTYQWQSSSDNSTWSDIGGATSATCTPSTASAGTTYYRLHAHDSYGDGFGMGAALVVNNPIVPTVGTASYSPSGTVAAGAQVIFSATVAANGSAITGYQWQSGDNSTWTNLPGAISATYTNFNVLTTAAGYYRLVATNGVGSAAGAGVQLTVSAGPNFFDYGTTAPVTSGSDIAQLSSAGQANLTGAFNYYIDSSTPPGQTFVTGGNADGYALSEIYIANNSAGTSGTGQTTYNLRIYSIAGDAATQVGSTLVSVNSGVQGTSGHWYKFAGFTPITLSPNTTYAFTLQRNGGGWWSLGNSSPNPYSDGEACLIPTAGGTIVTESSHNYDATFLARLAAIINPLTITTNPTSLLVGPNGSGSFSVAATSDGNITGYQWYQGASGNTSSPVSNGADANGTVFSGATTATLSFTTAAAGDSGNTYWCKVTGDYSGGTTANSTAATLTVYASKNLSWMATPADMDWNTTSADWSNTVTTASSLAFSSYDFVTLDDTGSGGTITIPGTVQPNFVTVSNITQSYTIAGSGKITGATGLTKTGNGTLTITATNDYAGATVINGGVVSISTIADGASPIGAGSLGLNGGTLQYTGASGTTTRGITLGDNGGVNDVATGDSLTLAGVITATGTGSLTKVGNGNLMLSGANTFSGGVTISNGIVGLGNSAGLGTGALTLAGGTVQNAAGVSLVNDVVVGDGGGTIKLGATSDFWVGSSLSGTGNLILGGASPGVNSLNVGLSANNMSGGSITIPLTGNNQTVVRFKSTTSGNAGVLWSVGGCPDRYVTLDFGDGTIEFGALTGAGILAGNGSGTKTVEVGALNADSTFAGKFLDGSGVLSLNKVGTGTLTLAGGPTAISGGINIYQGLLNVGVANALNSTTTITFGGGMLQYSAANQADYGAHIVNSGSPIAIDLNGTSVTFASPIPNSNAGGLVLTNSTGSGKLTLTANSLYYGDTYVAGGTLALSGSGNISDTGNIIVNSGSRFDVSTANAYTLGSAQTLAGSGTVTGAVTTVNTGSFISPGGTVPGNSYGEWVVGTLTFQNNLIMNGGGSAVFDLSPSHASGNDQIVINGNLKLGTADTIHLNALTSGGNLDETGDYVLFSVTGTLSMGSIPVLVFDNTPPGDAANWWIKASGKNVVLHYSLNPPPFVTSVIVTNTADGSTVVMRGQSVTVFATVQQTVNNLSSVTVDLSPIGGSATQAMALVGGSGGVYEYTYGPVAVGPGAVVGNDTIGVAATDTSSAVGTASTTLIVYATTETWSGLAADGNWSSTANWAGGLAPGYSGDTVIFTGSTGLSPNLEANYEVASLTFDGSADIFTIGSTSGKSLALDGMLNNSSANLQTISAPVVLNTGASINDNGSGLALSGTVSGASLAVSAGTVILAGANTYSGDTTIAAGATLLAGNTHAIPSGAGKGNVDVASSATLDVHGTNVSVNGLTDAGTVDNLGADPATLTVGNGNASSTFTGMIVNSLGAVSLVKTGSGTFTIGKNNLYAGGTTIQGGSVVLPNGADNAFGTGSLTLSNGTLVVQAGGGGSWNSGNACYLGNNLIIAPGSTNVIDDSVNNYGNLWVAGDNVQWTGTGTLKFQNNGGVNQPGLIWNGNPLATFNGTIILGSAANNNSFVFNGLAYSGSASGGTGAAVTTFDASGTAWNLGDIGYSVTQVADSGCTNIKMGSISGSNTNTVLKGNPSSSVNTTFEVGALGASTTFAGKITDWGAGGTCLTKVGSGSLTLLSTANSYTGPTTVSSGTLLVNGAIASPVTVNGGTFGGTGTVNNSVTVNSGGTLSPGASIGTLTISGNLSLSGNTLVELNQSLSPAQSNDFVNVTGTLTYGGTLTVNNLGPALAAGNHFRLFPPGGANAGGMTVVGSAGSGLAYSFNDGVLSVTSAAGSSAVITNSVSGGNLNLAWPSGQGWTLQSQTNSLSTGLSPTGWSAVSGAADGSYSIMINTTNPAVFYRLGK